MFWAPIIFVLWCTKCGSVRPERFEKQEEDAGGQRPYDPRMMLKIWLYGFGVNVRTTRKLEQRIREDLGFRYLAGGATPDHKR